MARSLWVGALLLVVLVAGCRSASREEPDGVAGTQGESAGGPSVVLAQAGEGDSQAGTAEDETLAVTVETVRMERRSKEELPLEQNQLSAFISGVGRTTLTVVGERRHYDLQLRLVSEGEAQEWSGDLWCCELRTTNPELPFVWAVWSEERMVHFRVVSSPGPVSYAAWVEGGTLCFEEVRASRDAETALAPYFSRCASRSETGSLTWGPNLNMVAHFSPPDASAVVHIWVNRKMGSGDFIPRRGTTNAGLDVRTQSIAKDDAGKWTVKVTGPHPRRVYTFVSPDGITWERK